jgi:hypothetical protein
MHRRAKFEHHSAVVVSGKRFAIVLEAWHTEHLTGNGG